ncbi:hypothetical protein Pcinc_015835 [Petrolisthes cinctipes]|uniref:Uncharacterized protein n=1 Tax=Petrolisthes cinctipes TaxID=88211 RepID=A0AAE1FS99_PETCI|nr:hypothetical protein Pcinc_015835 [Petrolisthes cinctipes]
MASVASQSSQCCVRRIGGQEPRPCSTPRWPSGSLTDGELYLTPKPDLTSGTSPNQPTAQDKVAAEVADWMAGEETD